MRRTLLMALVLGVVAVAAGVFITARTLPTDEEIQRVSFEELGLSTDLLDNPLVAAFMQETFGEVQSKVRDRLLDDARESLLLGGATMVALVVLGVAVIASDHRRRSPRPTEDGPPTPHP
jgi:ABC-type Fe3+ transport system permease subunit